MEYDAGQAAASDWQIPVVDIDQVDRATGKFVVDAAISHGFLYITGQNFGFNVEIIERIFDLVR